MPSDFTDSYVLEQLMRYYHCFAFGYDDRFPLEKSELLDLLSIDSDEFDLIMILISSTKQFLSVIGHPKFIQSRSLKEEKEKTKQPPIQKKEEKLFSFILDQVKAKQL